MRNDCIVVTQVNDDLHSVFSSICSQFVEECDRSMISLVPDTFVQ